MNNIDLTNLNNFKFPYSILFGIYSRRYHAVVLDTTSNPAFTERVYMFDSTGNLLWKINPDILNNNSLSLPNPLFTNILSCKITEDDVLVLFTGSFEVKLDAFTGKLISTVFTK